MKKEEKIKIDFPIQLVDISLIDFSVLKKLPAKLADFGLNRKNVSFEFNVAMNINPADEIIQMKIDTKFFAEKEKETLLGNIHVSGDFKVENIGESLKVLNGKLPNQFLASLIGIIVSSTRGMLVLKFKDTVMEGFFMPPINPLSFFPKQEKNK